MSHFQVLNKKAEIKAKSGSCKTGKAGWRYQLHLKSGKFGGQGKLKETKPTCAGLCKPGPKRQRDCKQACKQTTKSIKTSPINPIQSDPIQSNQSIKSINKSNQVNSIKQANRLSNQQATSQQTMTNGKQLNHLISPSNYALSGCFNASSSVRTVLRRAPDEVYPGDWKNSRQCVTVCEASGDQKYEKKPPKGTSVGVPKTPQSAQSRGEHGFAPCLGVIANQQLPLFVLARVP